MSNIYLQNTLIPEARDFTHYREYDLATLKALTAGASAVVIGGARAGQVIEIAAVYVDTAVVGGTSAQIDLGLGSTADALLKDASIEAKGTILNTGESFKVSTTPTPEKRVTVASDSDITLTVAGVAGVATAGKVVIGLKILDLPRFAS